MGLGPWGCRSVFFASAGPHSYHPFLCTRSHLPDMILASLCGESRRLELLV